MMQDNNVCKDSVFSWYFSEDSKRMLELYNAVLPKGRPLGTEVKTLTLDMSKFPEGMNVLSLFINENELAVFIEQQAVSNESIALWAFIYLVDLYMKVVPEDASYATELVHIPTSHVFVLYNTEADSPTGVARLSELYAEKSDRIFLDLAVHRYDIKRDLKTCAPLGEYAQLFKSARKALHEGLSTKDAAANAVQECIQCGVMGEFLRSNESEVTEMLTRELDTHDTASD